MHLSYSGKAASINHVDGFSTIFAPPPIVDRHGFLTYPLKTMWIFEDTHHTIVIFSRILAHFLIPKIRRITVKIDTPKVLLRIKFF